MNTDLLSETIQAKKRRITSSKYLKVRTITLYPAKIPFRNERKQTTKKNLVTRSPKKGYRKFLKTVRNDIRKEFGSSGIKRATEMENIQANIKNIFFPLKFFRIWMIVTSESYSIVWWSFQCRCNTYDNYNIKVSVGGW